MSFKWIWDGRRSESMNISVRQGESTRNRQLLPLNSEHEEEILKNPPSSFSWWKAFPKVKCM